MNFKVTNEIAVYAGYKNYIENMYKKAANYYNEEVYNKCRDIYNLTSASPTYLENLIENQIRLIVENKKKIQKNMHDGRCVQDIITVEEECIKAFNDQIECINNKRFVWRRKKLIKNLEENIKKSKDTIETNTSLLNDYDEQVSCYMINEEELFNQLVYLDDYYGAIKVD